MIAGDGRHGRALLHLPPDTRDFTGRAEQVGEVTRLIAAAAAKPGDRAADRVPVGSGRGREDDARDSRRAPGRRGVPRRAAVHQPARGGRPRAGSGRSPGRFPARARRRRNRHPRGPRRACPHVPGAPGRPAHARRARQRGRRGAGPPAAAGEPGLRGPGHQHIPAGCPGRRDRRPAGPDAARSGGRAADGDHRRGPRAGRAGGGRRDRADVRVPAAGAADRRGQAGVAAGVEGLLVRGPAGATRADGWIC